MYFARVQRDRQQTSTQSSGEHHVSQNIPTLSVTIGLLLHIRLDYEGRRTDSRTRRLRGRTTRITEQYKPGNIARANL